MLAEAMACGVPCVATDVGDARRILSSADFLVPAGDPNSLAQALVRALASLRETRGRDLGERARRSAEPFTFAAQVEGFAKVYGRFRRARCDFS